MRYVLDTCTFLWLATDQTKLSPAARIALAAVSNTLHLSVISVTETHRLIRKGKIMLRTDLTLDVWLRAMLVQHQIQDEPITLEIAHGADVLPVYEQRCECAQVPLRGRSRKRRNQCGGRSAHGFLPIQRCSRKFLWGPARPGAPCHRVLHANESGRRALAQGMDEEILIYPRPLPSGRDS